MFYKSFKVYTELDHLPTMITQQDELYLQQVEVLVCSQYCTSWIELIMIIHDFSSVASLTTWSLRTCSYSTVSCCSTTPAILGSCEQLLLKLVAFSCYHHHHGESESPAPSALD